MTMAARPSLVFERSLAARAEAVLISRLAQSAALLCFYMTTSINNAAAEAAFALRRGIEESRRNLPPQLIRIDQPCSGAFVPLDLKDYFTLL